MAVAALFSFQLLPGALALVFAGNPATYIVGGALVAAAAVIGLAAVGAIGPAWDALVTYSAAYLHSSAGSDPTWHIPLVVLPLLVVAGFTFRLPMSRLQLSALAWLVLGLLLILFQGRQLGHYATPLVVPAALLASHARRRAVAVGFGTLLLGLVAATTLSRYPQRGPTTEAIARWVRENTPESSELVWGVEANVYLASDRGVAGKFRI